MGEDGDKYSTTVPPVAEVHLRDCCRSRGDLKDGEIESCRPEGGERGVGRVDVREDRRRETPDTGRRKSTGSERQGRRLRKPDDCRKERWHWSLVDRVYVLFLRWTQTLVPSVSLLLGYSSVHPSFSKVGTPIYLDFHEGCVFSIPFFDVKCKIL